MNPPWTIIGDALPGPGGHERKRVQCSGCGATCVRRVYDIGIAKHGCVRCSRAIIGAALRKRRTANAAASRAAWAAKAT